MKQRQQFLKRLIPLQQSFMRVTMMRKMIITLHEQYYFFNQSKVHVEMFILLFLLHIIIIVVLLDKSTILYIE